jgi:hypothetical protein
MSLITKGLLVSGLGLAGVFAVLILFYFLTSILLVVFKPKSEE